MFFLGPQAARRSDIGVKGASMVCPLLLSLSQPNISILSMSRGSPSQVKLQWESQGIEGLGKSGAGE